MTQTDSYEVLVVGAGPAGTSAAVRAAELGARVGLVEARRTGGTCVNSGCVPTRVLAKTARFAREVRSAGVYGLDVGDPTVDWTRTVARVRQVVERIHAVKAEPERLADLGVDLVLEGRARFVDPHAMELSDTGRRVSGDAVVLCVGGHSRRLPVPGAELALVPEQVLDMPEVPRRLVVVGAGNTGAQLVTVFEALGAEVTLLEVAPRILMAMDEDISRTVQDSFEAHAVDVHVGIRTLVSLARVEGTEPHGDHVAGGPVRVTWVDADGSEQSREADAVIMCTGWPASVDGLGLDAAGIATDGRSIAVDEYFRTEVPHVFAAGDANQQAMLVQAAHAEAEAAATNAVLGPTRRAPHRLLPSGGFTDPDYAGVGLTEAQARERDPQVAVATVRYSELERAVIDDREQGFLKLVTDRRRDVLLGAHAAGESAVEVIQAVTTAMAAGVDLTTLAGVEFAYPTYSAVIGEAARRLRVPRGTVDA
ncbi:dihydrolipoyl dehydrogenase family protein [Aquipuribacter hungaricus]|uniref:Dihydrolipoyl dehydrogenase family protein n=1 Tax=Aquipuribacter hungaricus TaxID=545624 RepID=A0ABV7WJ81_9MICO